MLVRMSRNHADFEQSVVQENNDLLNLSLNPSNFRLRKEEYNNYEKDVSVNLSNLQGEVKILRQKLKDKQSRLEEADCQISHLKNQIIYQSKFCTSIGAVFCTLISHASKHTEIIDLWLSKNELENFFSIVNGTFMSFVSLHKESSSPINDEVFKYVLGLLNTVVNISACSEGTEFLISRSNGKDLLQKLVKHLPKVTSSSAKDLKKMILMILYNVSKNKKGAYILQEKQQIYKTLGKCLGQNEPNELRNICMKIIQFLITHKIHRNVTNPLNLEKRENIVFESNLHNDSTV